MMKMFSILILAFSINVFAKDDFSGIAEESLSISKELGYSVDEKAIQKRINDLILEIKKESKTKDDLLENLIKKINSLPNDGTFKTSFPEEDGLLSSLMATGVGNCFSYSILYLTLGEKLDINLRPILIPGHVFLKNDQRNIETTLNGKNISNENIAGLLHLDVAKTEFTPASRDQFTSGLYSNACLVAAYKGKVQEGLKYCDKAIKLNAGNGEAFINKSFIEGSTGDFENSLKDAQQGVKLYPQLAHAYFTLGNSYRKLKKIDDAKKAFIKAISIRPNVYRFHYNLGNVYVEQNQNDKAIESFSEAIRLNPEYTEAYTNRAVAYASSKKYLQAIKDYDVLLKKNPKNFDILFEKGRAYFMLKKYSLALKEFEGLRKQFPEQAKTEGVDDIISDLKKKKK